MSQPIKKWESGRSPFAELRLLKSQSAKPGKPTRGPHADAGADPWQSFRAGGLDVDSLKRLEAESVGAAATRPERKPLGAAGFEARRSKLLRAVPSSQVLEQRKSQHPPGPDLMAEQAFGSATVYYPAVFVEGSGLGWSVDDSLAESFVALYVFDYVPPADGTYQLTTFLSVWGKVFGRAHDQWWNSKDFSLDITCGAGASQPCGLPDETDGFYTYVRGLELGPVPQTIFHANYGNHVLPATEIDLPVEIQSTMALEGGVPAMIEIFIMAEAYAQGAGSYSGFDLGLGVLLCGIQQVSPIA